MIETVAIIGKLSSLLRYIVHQSLLWYAGNGLAPLLGSAFVEHSTWVSFTRHNLYGLKISKIENVLLLFPSFDGLIQ